MKKIHVAVLAAVVLAAGMGALAAGGGAAGTRGAAATGPVPVEKLEAIAAANKGSLVVVEYQLQYDKGDAPEGSGFAERCPYCGQYHGAGNVGQYVEEERPVERIGVLVDATHVVTEDVQLHPRFIKAIQARAYGSEGGKVAATISAYPKEQNALILELAGTPTGSKAANFSGSKEGPYTVIEAAKAEGRWTLGLRTMPSDLILQSEGSYFGEARGLVVDKEGLPVGMRTGLEVKADGSWRGNPLQWPAYTSAGMKELLGKVEGHANKGIVPVTLNFRAPKTTNPRERYRRGDEADSTVMHVLGVFVDSKTVLVLANLKAAATARLERVRVMMEPPMDAKFTATLTDFGAFVANTESAVAGTAGISAAKLETLRGAELPAAEISLRGEERVVYYQARRIAGLREGFRGNLYPEMASRDETMFLFDGQGDLLALPVPVREKASMETRYSSREQPILTSAALLGKALGNLESSSDKNNVPLSEAEEGRLAWMGIEMQQLTPDLARANNVSDQTRDGQTGGLVTFVYADSPAGKAGVEAGWVLLRLDVEGEPKPIEVQMEYDAYSSSPFPWDRLDQVSEQVYEQIPTPWPNAETTLLRSLTDLGFGKKFVAEFAHDKKVEKKEFTVAQGPATYNSAAKYKSAGLGITVREMTYEVRRYMQKKDDEPGVIIGKIEMGSKASVAGLKPYEVITHVNDVAVMNVKDFEKATKDLTELRLSIKRMEKGRIVKITLPKADGEGAAPKEGDAPGKQEGGGPG